MLSKLPVCNWLKCVPQSSAKLPMRLLVTTTRSYSTITKPKVCCIFEKTYGARLLTTTRKNSTKVNIEKKKYGSIVTRASLTEHSKTPLVVILGWNDSEVKHLQKYCALFEKKNWSTICLPNKPFNTFFRSDTIAKTIGLYVIDLIKDLTEKGDPVLMYAFSGGGSTVYLHIMEALATPGQQNLNAFKVVGSIFDGCPVKPVIKNIQKLQISITERIKNPVIRSLVWYISGIVAPIVIKRSLFMKRFFKDFGNLPLNGPELFLYSKADILADHEVIAEHIDHRKSQGVHVFSKLWQDSPHVSHYLKYPEEYTEVLENFLEVCFGSIKNSD